MKHVADRTEGEFNVLEKAKDFAAYVLRITQNEKNFPKRYRFSVVNKIQEKAMDIVENLIEAYEIYPNSAPEKELRLLKLKTARAELRSILTLTEVAASIFDIKASTFEYMTKQATEIKTHLTAWIRSDQNRFKV